MCQGLPPESRVKGAHCAPHLIEVWRLLPELDGLWSRCQVLSELRCVVPGEVHPDHAPLPQRSRHPQRDLYLQIEGARGWHPPAVCRADRMTRPAPRRRPTLEFTGRSSSEQPGEGEDTRADHQNSGKNTVSPQSPPVCDAKAMNHRAWWVTLPSTSSLTHQGQGSPGLEPA